MPTQVHAHALFFYTRHGHSSLNVARDVYVDRVSIIIYIVDNLHFNLPLITPQWENPGPLSSSKLMGTVTKLALTQ